MYHINATIGKENWSRIGGLKIHFDWIHRCTCMVETTSPTNVSITNISTSSLKDFYNENNHAPIPCIAVKLGITSLDPKSKVPKLVTTIQDSSMKSVLLAIDQIASTIVACGEEYRAKNDDSAFVPVLLNDVNVKSTMFMTTAKTEVRVLEVARADSIPDVPPPQETLELGLLQLFEARVAAKCDPRLPDIRFPPFNRFGTSKCS
ncbi:hypothetical protein CLOM_g2637 [Closterium sp. NIES-68]|nr:hypothetical protein CLOM_g2637 [Closterium sp. NIES-68]